MNDTRGQVAELLGEGDSEEAGSISEITANDGERMLAFLQQYGSLGSRAICIAARNARA